MKVYISGPITGKPGLNKQAFFDARDLIQKTGHIWVCPHNICAHIPNDAPWIEYMKVCLAELTKCDYIFMLPGWIWSRGARIEWVVAKLLGIKRIKL